MQTSFSTSAQEFRINFNHPGASTTFHQCVYILCHKDAALERAASLLRQKFGMTDLQDFMPHLSLLYSDMDMPSRCSHRHTLACMRTPEHHMGGFRRHGAVQGEDRH